MGLLKHGGCRLDKSECKMMVYLCYISILYEVGIQNATGPTLKLSTVDCQLGREVKQKRLEPWPDERKDMI